MFIYTFSNTQKHYWNETHQILAVVLPSCGIMSDLYCLLHIMTKYYFYNYSNK